jgi:16S rRNA C967 or C1407 C5-methylase (RsmB/RsmF family)
MIPPTVLDAEEGDIVLDVSAAPGSKTTQIAEKMN